jgi:hypothetical protein
MLSAADSYFDAIEHGQGKLAPFSVDCERHENGGQTTHNKSPFHGPWISARPKPTIPWPSSEH